MGKPSSKAHASRPPAKGAATDSGAGSAPSRESRVAGIPHRADAPGQFAAGQSSDPKLGLNLGPTSGQTAGRTSGQGAPVLEATGSVVCESDAHGRPTGRIAILTRQGQACLPRLLQLGATPGPTLALRAALSQVSPKLAAVNIEFLATLDGRLYNQSLRTDYFQMLAAPPPQFLHPACAWMTRSEAIALLRLPEERALLEAMHDPLAHPPASSPPPADPSSQPLGSHGATSGATGPLGGSGFAQSARGPSQGLDWSERAHGLHEQARESAEAGQSDLAKDLHMAAWKLEYDARSVHERRLITRLLQGEVRERTSGWKRDALLTALEEDPDSSTLARVRGELQTQTTQAHQQARTRRWARIAQVALVLPISIGLFLVLSRAWIAGQVPTNDLILPPVIGLGVLGGLAWSLLRQPLRDPLQALAPLGIGAFGAAFGFLLAQAGVFALGPATSAWTLCMGFVWGALSAALLELRRP